MRLIYDGYIVHTPNIKALIAAPVGIVYFIQMAKYNDNKISTILESDSVMFELHILIVLYKQYEI